METLKVTFETTQDGLNELVRVIENQVAQLKLLSTGLVHTRNLKKCYDRINQLRTIKEQLEVQGNG